MESIKQGEIWSVNFDPQIGREIAKIRPALILSNNLFNANSPLCIIVPLTSWQDKFKKRVWMLKLQKDNLNHLKNDSAINASQIKSFSKERLIEKIGKVELKVVENVQEILNEIMDSSFND